MTPHATSGCTRTASLWRLRAIPASMIWSDTSGLRWRKRRRPAGDGPHALPPPCVVGNEREVPSQLKDGGQLPTLVQCTTDSLGGRFVDGEHHSCPLPEPDVARCCALSHSRGTTATRFGRRPTWFACTGAAGANKPLTLLRDHPDGLTTLVVHERLGASTARQRHGA